MVRVHSCFGAVEDATLRWVADMFGLGREWGGCVTTGATGSNILGIGCGRDHVLEKRGGGKVCEVGLVQACGAAGVKKVKVLASMGHSSVAKAASVLGLGHGAVRDVSVCGKPWKMDLEKVRMEMGEEGTASIVVVGCGEVNTGRFAIEGESEMAVLRGIVDEFDGWIHVDGGSSPSPNQTMYLL